MGEVISRLDDLQAKLKCAVSAMSIINESVGDGVESEALFCVWNVLHDISEEMFNQLSNAYEIINNRNGKEV